MNKHHSLVPCYPKKIEPDFPALQPGYLDRGPRSSISVFLSEFNRFWVSYNISPFLRREQGRSGQGEKSQLLKGELTNGPEHDSIQRNHKTKVQHSRGREQKRQQRMRRLNYNPPNIKLQYSESF